MAKTKKCGSVTARLLAAGDLHVLSNTAAEVFDGPINEVSAKAFLEDPNHLLVVGLDEEKNDCVVGFASAVRLLHPDKETFELFINEVGVAPDYRRRGVASAIMKALFAEAKKRNCRLGWLAVDEDNEAALALYRTLGGKPPERQLHIDFDLGD